MGPHEGRTCIVDVPAVHFAVLSDGSDVLAAHVMVPAKSVEQQDSLNLESDRYSVSVHCQTVLQDDSSIVNLECTEKQVSICIYRRQKPVLGQIILKKVKKMHFFDTGLNPFLFGPA